MCSPFRNNNAFIFSEKTFYEDCTLKNISREQTSLCLIEKTDRSDVIFLLYYGLTLFDYCDLRSSRVTPPLSVNVNRVP
jgi:hypothetical protein